MLHVVTYWWKIMRRNIFFFRLTYTDQSFTISSSQLFWDDYNGTFWSAGHIVLIGNSASIIICSIYHLFKQQLTKRQTCLTKVIGFNPALWESPELKSRTFLKDTLIFIPCERTDVTFKIIMIYFSNDLSSSSHSFYISVFLLDDKQVTLFLLPRFH